MRRKVILDIDPHVDGALALTVALTDPRLDVVAVTAVAGSLSAEQATRNVVALVEQLDPPRWPRIGAASEPEAAPAARLLSAQYGPDGLGGANLAVADLHHRHPAEKVITEEIRRAPDEVSLVCLGPLTNVWQALRRDTTLAAMIDRAVVGGGALAAPGNVTPAAEFNIFFDPVAARDLFHARLTKLLVPRDVTTRVPFGLDRLDQLPDLTTNLGRVLRNLLPVAFRAYRQDQGMESIWLPGVVALWALIEPERFTFERMAGDVELHGELTRGMTVFDRRPQREWRVNFDVATEVDATGLLDSLVRQLNAVA
ncbi:MAG: nucleoside hydrolase [Planctomycetes bacterium]|nr:nucleoside hydrolase [Planctomycetota bacterium]